MGCTLGFMGSPSASVLHEVAGAQQQDAERDESGKGCHGVWGPPVLRLGVTGQIKGTVDRVQVCPCCHWVWGLTWAHKLVLVNDTSNSPWLGLK